MTQERLGKLLVAFVLALLSSVIVIGLAVLIVDFFLSIGPIVLVALPVFVVLWILWFTTIGD